MTRDPVRCADRRDRHYYRRGSGRQTEPGVPERFGESLVCQRAAPGPQRTGAPTDGPQRELAAPSSRPAPRPSESRRPAPTPERLTLYL